MTNSLTPLKDADFQINLMKDLADMCASELSSMGYTNITATNPQELCELYLNALYRRVSIQPRKFRQSKQLKVPTELKAGFELLKQRVENGDDLTPHLSRLLDKVDFNDPLLNAWKIHHFHLGTQPHKDDPKFVERTGPILLAMIQENDFYAIAIIEHGKQGNPDLFYDQDLIEILHENFPNMMKRYRINGIAAFPKPTNAEVKMARDAGITMFSQTNDGTLYFPSLGFTSVGGTTKDTGAQVFFDAMQVIRGVELLEKLIREKIEALEIPFSREGGKRPYKIVLTGFLNNGYARAREESSKVGLHVSQFRGKPGEEWLDVWPELE